jgi:hypothetical protein
MPRELLENRIIAGDPIRIGRNQVVPLTRLIRVHLFGLRGGLVWNRPHAVKIIGEDGTERMLPIHDITRRSQILLLGAGLIGSLLIWRFLRGRNSR